VDRPSVIHHWQLPGGSIWFSACTVQQKKKSCLSAGLTPQGTLCRRQFTPICIVTKFHDVTGYWLFLTGRRFVARSCLKFLGSVVSFWIRTRVHIHFPSAECAKARCCTLRSTTSVFWAAGGAPQDFCVWRVSCIFFGTHRKSVTLQYRWYGGLRYLNMITKKQMIFHRQRWPANQG